MKCATVNIDQSEASWKAHQIVVKEFNEDYLTRLLNL